MKHNWLSVSIFCEISHWNSLYGAIIAPLLKSKKIIGWEAKCKLFDERHRLDLYLRVDQKSQEKLVRFIHKEMTENLAGYPDSGISQEPPFSNEVLFMPFPNNSVQYGLFRISQNKKNENWLDTVLKNSIKLLVKNQSAYGDVLTLLFNLYGFIINQMADGDIDFTTQVIKRTEQIDRVKEKGDFRILYDSEKELFNELLCNIRIGCDVNEKFFLTHNIGINVGNVAPDWSREKPQAMRIELTVKYLKMVSDYLLVSNFIKWSVLTALHESMSELEEVG